MALTIACFFGYEFNGKRFPFACDGQTLLIFSYRWKSHNLQDISETNKKGESWTKIRNKGTGMAQRKMVEHNALIQAIEMGQPKVEIMQQFGFKTLGALKVAYLDALVALGKVTRVNKKAKKQRVDNVVGINSRGSLIIPKKLVDALGLDKNTLFRVKKQGADLILIATENRPKTILRKKRE